MAQQIQVRRDTAANWTSVNPVLASGEQALETDTRKRKTGDGTTAWASLAYDSGTGAVSSVAGRTGAVTLAAADVSGLGTAATVNTGTTNGTVPLLGASGTLAVARLATGTPDGTKFVRDDGTLATPAGGGGAVSSVVGQTGAVTDAQIVASTAVANALAAKAPLASPALTGTPTVPTAAALTSNTQVASTAYADTAAARSAAGVAFFFGA